MRHAMCGHTEPIMHENREHPHGDRHGPQLPAMAASREERAAAPRHSTNHEPFHARGMVSSPEAAPARRSHDGPAPHGSHQAQGGPREGHGRHAGHSVERFRSRFWISLVLTLPAVIWGHMLGSLTGYMAPMFPGSQWVAPIFGTTVLLYGGLVFLQGAWRELKDRLPGMMTLISLAITVAFVFSAAVTLGFPGMPLWEELATLVTIMLLGHWIEMKSIFQARGALQDVRCRYRHRSRDGRGRRGRRHSSRAERFAGCRAHRPAHPRDLPEDGAEPVVGGRLQHRRDTLTAGVLYPWGILLNPAVGAVLMSLSTVSVAINAQLLHGVDTS
jgi:cation transport ATPase